MVEAHHRQFYHAGVNADHHLVVYGTLAPGQPNHHQLSGLRGDWQTGVVRGRLVKKGWGAALGFPVLTLADDGEEIEVHLFASPDLPDHWERLDAFEGSEYRRTLVKVETRAGNVDAWIYVDAGQAAP
ncbi:MAG: gamma-glutamylcyclotransferase family protein [Rhodospirillaceae bacterium]